MGSSQCPLASVSRLGGAECSTTTPAQSLHQHQHQQPAPATSLDTCQHAGLLGYMYLSGHFYTVQDEVCGHKSVGKNGYQPPSTRGVVSSEQCKSAGLPPAPCCCVWPGHNVPPPPQIFSRIKIFSDNLSARHVSSECSDSRSASPVSPRQRRVLIKIPQIELLNPH